MNTVTLDNIALERFANFTVVGVGAAGIQMTNLMIHDEMTGIDFIAIDTDAQSLLHAKAHKRLQIGEKLTHGLCAENPSVATDAARESKAEVIEALRGRDIVCIVAGMGGSTGTGAAPVIAYCAKEAGALVISVVTEPYSFEILGNCKENVQSGIKKLRGQSDSLFVVSPDRLLQIKENDLPLKERFHPADAMVCWIVRAISDSTAVPSDLLLDRKTLGTIFSQSKASYVGVGEAPTADEAVQKALESLSLEKNPNLAKGMLIHVMSTNSNITVRNTTKIFHAVKEALHSSADVAIGVTIRESEDNNIRVMLLATRFVQPPDKNCENSEQDTAGELGNLLRKLQPDDINSI